MNHNSARPAPGLHQTYARTMASCTGTAPRRRQNIARTAREQRRSSARAAPGQRRNSANAAPRWNSTKAAPPSLEGQAAPAPARPNPAAPSLEGQAGERALSHDPHMAIHMTSHMTSGPCAGPRFVSMDSGWRCLFCGVASLLAPPAPKTITNFILTLPTDLFTEPLITLSSRMVADFMADGGS